MYNKKLQLMLAIFLALLGFATVQMKAQTIPIVQADTVFAGFGGGSVSGIVFGQTGETVIVMHDAQPVEINIKTKQIVREFEKVPNATEDNSKLFFVREKGWVCCNARSSDLNGAKGFYGIIIWDYNSGKIINSKQPGIISNGKLFYTQIRNNDIHKQYYCRYNINNLSIIDSVEFEQNWFHGVQQRFSAGFGIIPNSNKVIIGVNGPYSHREKSELFVLDFDTKEYTPIEIPFESGQDSSELIGIAVSETGKYFVVSINIPFDQTAYLFYDKDFKFIFKESRKHLNSLFEDPGKVVDGWVPHFIHDDYLLPTARAWSVPDQNNFYFCDFYSITDKLIKKRIFLDYGSDVDVYYNDIVILFSSGKIALLNLDALPVEENKMINPENQAEFQDGKILINSEISGLADINILDYKGNILYSKKGLYILAGNNSLQIDFTLPNGIYFLLVKSVNGNISYKFLVSR